VVPAVGLMMRQSYFQRCAKNRALPPFYTSVQPISGKKREAGFLANPTRRVPRMGFTGRLLRFLFRLSVG